MRPSRFPSLVVACVGVTNHSQTRIVRQHALDAFTHLGSAIRHQDLARME